MCLAVPAKIIEIKNLLALVDIYGVRKEISIILLPEEAEVGDYVLVHAGFALQKIDHAAAEESLRIFREYAEMLAKEEKVKDITQK